jgi:hypothetical protein
MKDIRKFWDARTLLAIVASAIAVDTAGLFVWRYTSEPDAPISVWYDKFGLVAYMLDVLSIVIGMVLAQIVASAIGGPFNLVAFLVIVVAIQMTHDLFFSQVVVPMIPKGRNSIIDLMLSYSTMRGAEWVLVVDALYMILTTVSTLVLLEMPLYVSWFKIIGWLYATGYILFTHTPVRT